MADRSYAKVFFHWKYANWVIALILAVAMSALFAEKFGLTYACLLLGLVYSIGCWLFSDTLQNKCRSQKFVVYVPNDPRRPRIATACRMWQVIPCVLLVAGFGSAAHYTRSLQIEKELLSLDGHLYLTGDHPSEVPLICQPKHTDQFTLLAGGNQYAIDSFPAIIVSIANRNRLIIDRDDAGNISITGTIIGRDGKVVVDLDRGKYLINRNNYLKLDRQQDRSKLAVYDQFGDEVLYLHLVRKNLLVMRAQIYDPSMPYPIILTNTRTIGIGGQGNRPAEHLCFVNFSVVFVVD